MRQRVDAAALLPLITDGISDRGTLTRASVPGRRPNTSETHGRGIDDRPPAKRLDKECLLAILEAISGTVSARLRSTL
jgi:hypothetical protein